MGHSDSPPSPGRSHGLTTGAERKLTPDLARGVMLLLIAMAYAGVYAGISFLVPSGVASPVDVVSRFLTVLILDNRAFPMFAILLGYGMVQLVARRLQAGSGENEARRILRRRSLFLILFGAVHAILVYPGEILLSYGVAGLVLGWLLFRPERAIRRAIAILTPVYAVTVTLAMIGVGIDGENNLDGAGVIGYTRVGDWMERIFGVPFAPLFIGVAYPLLLLVVLGFWAGRRRLLDDPAKHRTLLTRIAVVGITGSLLGALPAALVTVGAFQPGALPTGLFLALQNLTGVLGGAGYAALFGVLSASIGERRGPITRAVAAVGQRSLTFYLFNSVMVAIVLHPQLGGVGTRVDSFGALCVALAVWLLAVLLAGWLDRSGRPGPMDALLRRLVYRGAAPPRGGATAPGSPERMEGHSG